MLSVYIEDVNKINVQNRDERDCRCEEIRKIIQVDFPLNHWRYRVRIRSFVSRSLSP